MSKAIDKVAKARAGLVLDHPFFGSLALRLKLVEDPTCDTAWTDGKSLGVNPDFVEALSLDKVKGLVCHEIMHCANQHMVRRGDRDARRWNAACDYAINPMILGCRMQLPEGGLVDPAYDNMSAEQIYGILPQGSGGGNGQSKPGDGSGGKGNQSGSDPGGCGEVRDTPNPAGNGKPSMADLKQAGQDWKIAVTQAATQAQAMGNLPGALKRLVSDIVDPKLDWREVLHRFTDMAAKNDYRWFPPNRRHVHNGLYLPSSYSEVLGSLTLVVDTSGSIRKDVLTQFASEMSDISGKMQAGIKVVYCDYKVNADAVQDFEAGETLALNPVGGGGTDFRPPFEYLEQIEHAPACLVYFTDGECDRFPVEPPYPVLWAVYGRMKDSFDPPFGEVVGL